MGLPPTPINIDGRRKSRWSLKGSRVHRWITTEFAERLSDSGALLRIHAHVRFHLPDGRQQLLLAQIRKHLGRGKKARHLFFKNIAQ